MTENDLALINEFKELGEYKESTLFNAFEELYKRDMFAFATEGLGYSSITTNTHLPMIEALESTVKHDEKRVLICVPRGTFKSTIGCVTYPIWLLINNPNLRILIDSELYTNSKNFLREIKGHLESEHLTSVFGHFKSKKGDNWSESEIIIRQRTKIKKEASITVAGIGAEKTGQHYDVIVIDDANSPTNSNTVENRQKVIEHYRYLQAILEPKGTIVVIGTRYADDDLIGYILKNEVNYDRQV